MYGTGGIAHMSSISFVYFDVGGVLIRDFSSSEKWERMKVDMGLPPVRDKEYDEYYHLVEKDLALGKVDIDNLMQDIEKRFGFHFPSGFSMLSYFLDHFEANDSIWPIAELCRTKGVKIGLLTDQYPRLLDGIKERKLLPPVPWNVEIDSTIVKMKKPSPEIYELAGRKANVPPAEILFIDNKQANLDPAARLGWQTHFYNSQDYSNSSRVLEDLLSGLL